MKNARSDWPNPHYRALCNATYAARDAGVQLRWTGSMADYLQRYGAAEMKSNFEACLAETLHHEGGWADNPKDPGGATMKGVTIGAYSQFKGRKVAKDELRNISDADLLAIYRRNYWDKVKAGDLPKGLDLVAFDGAVNSGPSRGAKWLQTAVGVPADGSIGPQTIAAAHSTNTVQAIDRACDARLAFLRGLKTWPTFGKGWTARVESIRKAAKVMAGAPIPVFPPAGANPPTSRPAGLFAALAAFLAALFGKDKRNDVR